MRLADLSLRLLGATSGETVVRAAAAASGAITLPAGTTDFSGTGGAGQVVKQTTAGGAFTVAQVAAATDLSGQVPVANGGTNATTAGAALTNLGAAPIASPSFTGNVTAAGSLTVGGNANPSLSLDSSGAYTALHAPDSTSGSGAAVILVGAAANGNNVYCNTTHFFNNRAGASTFAYFNATATYNVSGAWSVISDFAAKRDIVPYERGLDAVLHLEPVTFSYNGRGGTTDDGRTHLGLIADDVAAVMPEITGTHLVDEVELSTLSPGLLIYALINSCKELAARVEALEAALDGGTGH